MVGQYLREEELTEQLISIMDQIDINQLGVQHKFEEEIKRFNKFHRSVLGIKNLAAAHQDVDLRTYAKYILREGANEEKRELMGCFRTRIMVKNKNVSIDLNLSTHRLS